MKNHCLKICFFLISLSVLMFSCKKTDEPDDKNKIDIKGTLMNGDMKNPNIVATFSEKTLCVRFYDNLGDCTISINNTDHSIAICDTVETYYGATYWYNFYDKPLTRYHLVISDGTDEAEGWFNNFKIVAVKPH